MNRGPAIEKRVGRLLALVPRRHRALLPTPVHRLDGLSERLGADIWCKRDDLTGFGFGGNKARKLDFLLGEALAQGADTLLAVGANQSNFCRMAAAYGSAEGLDVHLVLGGRRPRKATGNLLLDGLFGATCHHVDAPEWAAWEAAAARLEKRLAAEGRRVYRMPVGGSTPVGALGYVEAMAEIAADERRLGVRFDSIVFASSSAGTQAGLVVGQALTGWRGRILGISTAKPRAQQERDVAALASATAALLGAARARLAKPVVDDDFLGAAYAARTLACEEAMELFAQAEGIVLDRVYTGKAAAGLVAYARSGRLGRNRRALFIHTGGGPEVFE